MSNESVVKELLRSQFLILGRLCQPINQINMSEDNQNNPAPKPEESTDDDSSSEGKEKSDE